MNKKRDTGIRAALSVIFTVLLQMDADMYVSPLESFYGKSRVFEIILATVFYCSFHVWENKTYRYKKWSLVTGAVLAGFYALGYNVERHLDLFSGSNGSWIPGKLFLKWLVCWYCFATIILSAYGGLDRIKYMPVSMRVKGISGAVRQICVMMLLSVCWMPALIGNWPGILYADSFSQIYQILGIEKMSTHHPIVHTLLLKSCIAAGGDIEKGIAGYTLISFFAIIFIFSYMVNLMAEEAFDIRAVVLFIVICAFFPPVSRFSIAVIKDGWFAAFAALYLLELYLVCVKEKTADRYLAGLAIAAVGTCLFRKNGVYLLAFTAAYLCFCMRKHKTGMGKVLAVCILAICLNFCVEKGAVSLFGVVPGSSREMLSWPIQQMARIEKNEKELSAGRNAAINSFFTEESSLGDVYYPLISDPAKNLFSEEKFSGREIEFATLSLRLLAAYPEESLEAFLCSSFGYWYPVPINWFYAENNSAEPNLEETVRRHDYPAAVDYVYFNEWKNIAGVDVLTSIGLVFWLFLIISGYFIAGRKHRELLLMVPLGALWITSAASPVYNELRYVLAIYPVLPVVCQLVIGSRDDRKDAQAGHVG